MRRGLSLVASWLALVACGSNDRTVTTSAAPTAPADQPDPGSPWPDVVAVDRIEVLQGTTVTLLADGEATKPNAPIIAGRPGLVRVHAKLTAAAKSPAITADLHVTVPGQPETVVSDTPKRLTEYDAADLSTTFDFDLPETAFAKDARYAMTLRDPKSSASYTYAPDGGFRIPAEEAPTLKVQFIPIQYKEDGSNRLPALDDVVVQQYRSSLLRLYPTSKVEVSTHAVLPWSGLVEGDGTGWDQLLAAIMQTRRHDPVADDVYYVGVFEPAVSLSAYCSGGCVMGVAPAPGITEIGMRSALIIGYGGDGRNGTLAQELAHAMGRLHAPCGNANFIDDDYPYANARLGVPGWDIVDKQLFDPLGRTFDFMSYCGPVWTSDYTYKAIFDRMVEVKAAMTAPPAQNAKHTEQSWLVDARGELTKGPEVEVTSASRDPGLAVHFEDARGRRIASEGAIFRPYDNVPGGILVTPKMPASAVRARAEGLLLRRH